LILLIIIVLGILQQGYSQSDTICFPVSTYKQVLKLAVTGKHCDSLLSIREAQLSEMTELVDLSETVINQQNNQINRLSKFKKWFYPLIGVSLAELSIIILILAL